MPAFNTVVGARQRFSNTLVYIAILSGKLHFCNYLFWLVDQWSCPQSSLQLVPYDLDNQHLLVSNASTISVTGTKTPDTIVPTLLLLGYCGCFRLIVSNFRENELKRLTVVQWLAGQEYNVQTKTFLPNYLRKVVNVVANYISRILTLCQMSNIVSKVITFVNCFPSPAKDISVSQIIPHIL